MRPSRRVRREHPRRLGGLTSPSDEITLGEITGRSDVRSVVMATYTSTEVEDAALPLIQSKLEAPVPRPRIARRELLELCAGPPRKLTLIRAPAGWGKSTLLADWHALESEMRPFAWVALDGGDNDPVRFWTYVIHALRTLDSSAGEVSLPMLRAPRVSVVENVLPALCNELTALPHQVVLVLDDYHLVRNPEIDEGLSFFLEHLPRTLELVLSSRSEPALPLARLRARGELAEIDAHQLRFSEEEAELFLNDLHGLDLDREDVIRLRELTEGWAAGLYLATLTMRGRASAHEFIEAFAGDNRHVVDYLSWEVLAGLPEEMRSFLLQTSVLQRLCASLCDAVIDRPGSARMLHELERSNFFLIPLDTKREWYYYHHLFGELLRHELTLADPEHARTLHRRASAWHREHGDPSEAIHHATAAGDVADASELILGHWIELRNEARLETLLSWLDGLPHETVKGDARLCLVKASTLQEVGQITEADEWLAAATPGAADSSLLAGPVSVASGVAACQAINQYFLGDVSGIAETARPALELEEAGSDYWRSALLTTYGVSVFLGGEERIAVALLDEAVTSTKASGHSLALIHALGWCAVVHAEIRESGRADRVLDETEALRRTQIGLTQYFGMSMAHVARGKLLERQGRLKEADEALARGIELARRGDAKFDLSYGLLTHAGVKGGLGDRHAARDMLREARQTAESCADPGVLPELVAKVERRLRLVPSSATRTPYEEDLSDRELAVLRLLATDLTQRGIGEALYVSFNTVKTHVKSIFRKLDVATRPDAVSRARELRLL
jgi:LuxR family maltose regulon positive regulatory protein